MTPRSVGEFRSAQHFLAKPQESATPHKKGRSNAVVSPRGNSFFAYTPSVHVCDHLRATLSPYIARTPDAPHAPPQMSRTALNKQPTPPAGAAHNGRDGVARGGDEPPAEAEADQVEGPD